MCCMRTTSPLPWNAVPVEALQFLRASPVDLVLVDLVSSNAEGFEFLRQLQESPPATFTLVTALTDEDNTVDKLRAFDLGVCDCMGKPFEALVFRARLRAQSGNEAPAR